MKPKYGHHDDTYPLPERRGDALGAYGLIGLSDQSADGVAKFVQKHRPWRRVCAYSMPGWATGSKADVSASWRQPGPRAAGVMSDPAPEGPQAFCPGPRSEPGRG
jgi:hypothetical protein